MSYIYLELRMVSFQPSKKQNRVLFFINLIFELLKIQGNDPCWSKILNVLNVYWMSIGLGGWRRDRAQMAIHAISSSMWPFFSDVRGAPRLWFFRHFFFLILCRHSRSFFCFFFVFFVMYRLMRVVLKFFIFLLIFCRNFSFCIIIFVVLYLAFFFDGFFWVDWFLLWLNFWVFFLKIFAGTLLLFLFFFLSKKIYDSRIITRNFFVFFLHILNMIVLQFILTFCNAVRKIKISFYNIF